MEALRWSSSYRAQATERQEEVDPVTLTPPGPGQVYPRQLPLVGRSFLVVFVPLKALDEKSHGKLAGDKHHHDKADGKQVREMRKLHEDEEKKSGKDTQDEKSHELRARAEAAHPPDQRYDGEGDQDENESGTLHVALEARRLEGTPGRRVNEITLSETSAGGVRRLTVTARLRRTYT